MENEINMNIEPKKNDYPENFNFATDLRYDHWLDTKPDNPTISLVVEKKGIPTTYKISINEVKNEIIT
jgi:hypothetical protein